MNERCCIFTECVPGKCSFVFVHFEQILSLMGLNVFSLLFGFSALLAGGLATKQPVLLSTSQQVSLLFLVLLNKSLTLTARRLFWINKQQQILYIRNNQCNLLYLSLFTKLFLRCVFVYCI